jgi:hypothetical protein
VNPANPSAVLRSSASNSTVDSKSVTFLCADAPDEGWGAEETAIFANKFGARSLHGHGIDFVLSFTEPATALRAAVVWQRLAAGTRPRVALHTVDCNEHPIEADAHAPSCVQEAIDLGSRLAMDAAGGTIALSPDSYAVVREQITREIRDALVMTEVDEGEVTQASILLAPRASAELSTFAGLGLT